jgi:2-polyprenyl-6-methoxyphenol hydroxylase-like FAD-dependent oxidoreductase
VVADLSRLRTAHPYIAMVPQWDRLNLLAEAGDQESTFTLRMCTEAVELLRDGHRVRGVRYRAADGTSGEITADLTVGCDGRASMARDAVSLPTRRYPVRTLPRRTRGTGPSR